ncbi:MAG: glycosyltransferase family 1 protein [Bacteroidales bacterium]|jgi:hypothetical protein
MHVLLVYREYLNDNLFVQILRDSLREKKCEVECSVENFWNCDKKYDIINIQWPEEFFYWDTITDESIENLKNRINYFKKSGTKIFYTRHNIIPHYANNNLIRVYRLVEEMSDGIIHMGKFSLYEMNSNSPEVKAQSFIIPHHIYERTYNETMSKQEARKKLNLPKDKFIIMAFGKFRNWGESKMVIRAFLLYRNSKKYLLAPRILVINKHNSRFKKIIYSIMRFVMSIFSMNVGSYDEVIDNLDLPFYMAASDVIFVQRKNILNSGNVPLAFLFKKVVIGPDKGNIKELLFETNNPVFSPDNNKSIVKALEKSYILVNNCHGEKNYKYALNNMSVKLVSQKYLDAYNMVCGK